MKRAITSIIFLLALILMSSESFAFRLNYHSPGVSISVGAPVYHYRPAPRVYYAPPRVVVKPYRRHYVRHYPPHYNRQYVAQRYHRQWVPPRAIVRPRFYAKPFRGYHARKHYGGYYGSRHYNRQARRDFIRQQQINQANMINAIMLQNNLNALNHH